MLTADSVTQGVIYTSTPYTAQVTSEMVGYFTLIVLLDTQGTAYYLNGT